MIGAGVATVTLSESGSSPPVPKVTRLAEYWWDAATVPWYGDCGALRVGEYIYVSAHDILQYSVLMSLCHSRPMVMLKLLHMCTSAESMLSAQQIFHSMNIGTERVGRQNPCATQEKRRECGGRSTKGKSSGQSITTALSSFTSVRTKLHPQAFGKY